MKGRELKKWNDKKYQKKRSNLNASLFLDLETSPALQIKFDL